MSVDRVMYAVKNLQAVIKVIKREKRRKRRQVLWLLVFFFVSVAFFFTMWFKILP